jgi:Outer membrane protein beta-barrel domain
MIFKKSFTFGFEGGVNGGYNFTDNLGVSIGMFYASQGQKYKNLDITDAYGTATLNQTIRLSYLKIPLKFVFNTNPQKSISLTGFAGFYLGFLTGYKQTLKVTGTGYYADMDMTQVMKGKTITETNGSSTDQYDLIGKPFKSTNFGLTLGAGIQKKLSEKLFLQFMLNYQLGFGDVKNVASQIRYSADDIQDVYKSDDPNRTVSHKNSELGIMIGLKKYL